MSPVRHRQSVRWLTALLLVGLLLSSTEVIAAQTEKTTVSKNKDGQLVFGGKRELRITEDSYTDETVSIPSDLHPVPFFHIGG